MYVPAYLDQVSKEHNMTKIEQAWSNIETIIDELMECDNGNPISDERHHEMADMLLFSRDTIKLEFQKQEKPLAVLPHFHLSIADDIINEPSVPMDREKIVAFYECVMKRKNQETQPMTHPEWRNKLDTDETVLLSHINGSADPVFQTTKGWFFWDETWSSCFGPFDSQPQARAYLRVYAAGL